MPSISKIFNVIKNIFYKDLIKNFNQKCHNCYGMPSLSGCHIAWYFTINIVLQ